MAMSQQLFKTKTKTKTDGLTVYSVYWFTVVVILILSKNQGAKDSDVMKSLISVHVMACTYSLIYLL